MQEVIRELVTTLTDTDEIKLEQPLYELGVDSLATVNLLVELSLRADVDLEDFVDDMETPKSVADLCAVMAMFEEAGVCS
ncbi:acyl carrier protein [Vibrio cholerae]|uniref:acyl carrier protein n=1 Tax=Vibrio cholerae TaxID=666 RepID=UPI001C2FF42E